MVNSKIDLSHQEVERLIEELDKLYAQSHQEWLSIAPIQEILCRDLGYEDVPEFEDALNGSFVDFLKMLPIVELRINPEVASAESEDTMSTDPICEANIKNIQFRIKPEPPRSEWVPRKFILKISDRSQLWNVTHKSPYARILIPEMEFEMCPDGVRRIDSIYNHLSKAAMDLGNHIRQGGHTDDVADKIFATINMIGIARDVEAPWHWVVIDPSGISEISNMEGVEVITGPDALLDVVAE